MICLARRQNATNRSFPSGKRCLLLVLRVLLSCSWFFACPAGATAQPLVAGCLLAAMPLRDSWCPVGAVPPYGWDVSLAGKITFLPARLGPKPLFLLLAKEKAVLDSEKEKVDRWKSWGGAVQPGVGFVLLWYPSGEGLWGIPFVSGGLRLSDPWSLLRHCR